MMERRILSYRIIAALVAVTYFGFRTELFRQEYDEFHPAHPGYPSLTVSSVNWETYDKDNAPKAFVVDAAVNIDPIAPLTPLQGPAPAHHVSFQLIHDKSPPQPFKIA